MNASRSPPETAHTAACVGSIYPHLLSGAQLKFSSHPTSTSPAAAAAANSTFDADLRSRLLVDARSAFSCVRRASRDRDRQPEVGARDVTRPTTSTGGGGGAKPRIWCIADVATSPDNGPSRPPPPPVTRLSPLTVSAGVHPV